MLGVENAVRVGFNVKISPLLSLLSHRLRFHSVTVTVAVTTTVFDGNVSSDTVAVTIVVVATVTAVVTVVFGNGWRGLGAGCLEMGVG
eukprot:1355153-Amorphochlora_amoeboformis.AAC.1